MVADGDLDKFVPAHICLNDAVLNQSLAISVGNFFGSENWSLVAEMPSSCSFHHGQNCSVFLTVGDEQLLTLECSTDGDGASK